MARAESEEQPKDFAYVHLWVDSEGETHIQDAKMKGFELKKYAADPQFVKDDIEAPTKIVFTELAPGIEQDYHPCPEVQFVACLAGAWKIKTTDGAERTMKAGEVLFQDDVEKSPAKKTPKHWSAVVGDQPCQQMVVQVGNRKPQVDKPGVL